MHIIRLGLATTLLCALASSAEAQSFGRWDIPSTTCQFFGHGFSGGHHAPMVRMPGSKPVYVPRIAIVPPRERMPDPGKYPPQVYQCHDYGASFCSGCGHEHYAPQVHVYQQPMQPTLAPVTPQPTFAAPPVKRESAKPQAKPVTQPMRKTPAPKMKKKSSLPSPPMPTADPLSTQSDQQAFYGF